MQTFSSDHEASLKKNYQSLLQNIESAAERAGRSPAEIRLIAVSKGHDFASIKALYALGQRDFGESYGQELQKKIALARSAGINDIEWHFIGAIQSNKLKIIKQANFVHSIGSLRHAELLDELLEQPLKIFLEINLDQDQDRPGFWRSDIPSALKEMLNLDKLEIKGFMAVLPNYGEPSGWFSMMAQLKEEILEQSLLPEVLLSMGMSQDYAEAIALGANWLRIGTDIFGSRLHNNSPLAKGGKAKHPTIGVEN